LVREDDALKVKFSAANPISVAGFCHSRRHCNFNVDACSSSRARHQSISQRPSQGCWDYVSLYPNAHVTRGDWPAMEWQSQCRQATQPTGASLTFDCRTPALRIFCSRFRLGNFIPWDNIPSSGRLRKPDWQTTPQLFARFRTVQYRNLEVCNRFPVVASRQPSREHEKVVLRVRVLCVALHTVVFDAGRRLVSNFVVFLFETDKRCYRPVVWQKNTLLRLACTVL